jgi:hypothetical protein
MRQNKAHGEKTTDVVEWRREFCLDERKGSKCSLGLVLPITVFVCGLVEQEAHPGGSFGFRVSPRHLISFVVSIFPTASSNHFLISPELAFVNSVLERSSSTIGCWVVAAF